MCVVAFSGEWEGWARGQDLRNYNSRSKVKINQVPGGTFLKRSGPLARIKKNRQIPQCMMDHAQF